MKIIILIAVIISQAMFVKEMINKGYKLWNKQLVKEINTFNYGIFEDDDTYKTRIIIRNFKDFKSSWNVA